jgi:hypothetical protein
MKLKRIIMQPLAVVELTTAEVNLLEHWANQHHDATCQSMAVPGGVIHGLKHRHVRASATLNLREVDLLVRCLDHATEGLPVYILRQGLQLVLRRLSDRAEASIAAQIYDVG